MKQEVDWTKAMRQLIKKYRHCKHPLQYGNLYQLVIMVVLSAQDSDRNINQVAPDFFAAFPNIQSLVKASPEDLYPYVRKVRGSKKKSVWIIDLAKKVKKDSNIPLTLEGLDDLPGIGRKSANVIQREAGVPPEGIIVDLHVMRVAPRLGIATETNPVKVETQLMEVLSRQYWDAGMAMSFLGREICRPKPECGICLMKTVCAYYQNAIGT